MEAIFLIGSNPATDEHRKCIEKYRKQISPKPSDINEQSIVEFIRSIRIKRAAQLLKQNTASISEIAYMTGFETPSYFSKCFKDELGIIPSEYANSGK